MGRKRKNGMSEEKRNIIGQLIEMYDIMTAADIQGALKDLLGGTIQDMLEAELDQQMEVREESEPEYRDSRNGYKPKTLRSTLKYVADKDKKAFANDLKTIYHVQDEQTALACLDDVRTTWETKYPGCMKRWSDNWDCISPMFKFSQTARKVMYTTNAIESLNSGFRRLNRGRTVFPIAMALTKALYLATWELTKKWTMPVRNWGQVYAELDIMYPGRLSRN